MLIVSDIRENKAEFIEGLNKRGIADAAALLDEVIALDEKRKSTQTQLDEMLAESNKISKSIGLLMKEGKKEEADEAKNRTSDLKNQIKDLSQIISNVLFYKKNQITKHLQNKLKKNKYNINKYIRIYLFRHGCTTMVYFGTEIRA